MSNRNGAMKLSHLNPDFKAADINDTVLAWTISHDMKITPAHPQYNPSLHLSIHLVTSVATISLGEWKIRLTDAATSATNRLFPFSCNRGRISNRIPSIADMQSIDYMISNYFSLYQIAKIERLPPITKRSVVYLLQAVKDKLSQNWN